MVTAQICYASSGSFTSHRVRLCENTVKGAYGLSSLSDNTGKSNHLQMSEIPPPRVFSSSSMQLARSIELQWKKVSDGSRTHDVCLVLNSCIVENFNVRKSQILIMGKETAPQRLHLIIQT